MQTNLNKKSLFWVTVVLVTITLMLNSCKKDDPSPQPVTIDSFTPATGSVGATVTIIGANFSPTPANNIVTFNGSAATVTTATVTQLTTTVPTGATTGKISVTVNGLTATSATDFTFFPTPTVTSFTPEFCLTGTTPTVTITGTNFGNLANANAVMFNGTSATVSAASPIQLTVTVPAGATSGKITVSVNGITGTSATDFLIGCPDLIITNITVSNISGNRFDVAYSIKNIGTIPVDINRMDLQVYVSKNITLVEPVEPVNVNYQGAGGFGDIGFPSFTLPLFQPNEVRTMTQNAVNVPNRNIVTFPYVVLQVLDVPNECGGNTNNNELGKLIQ